MEPWDMRSHFLELVKQKGGFKCLHAHFDKSYLISPETLKLSQASLQDKWKLYRQLKESYTPEDLSRRITRCCENMIAQGVTHCRTFVDADKIVGLDPIIAALGVAEQLKDKLTLETAIQPLEGVVEKESRARYEEACALADCIGGLPDRDEDPAAHLDIIFNLAVDMDKPVDIHVGQNNTPQERETEMVLSLIPKYGLEGRVRLVHAISLSCQPKKERDRIISTMKDLGVEVIVCPSAAISMKQRSDLLAPIHNSIAPVMELIEGGVEVSLGIDNIHDLFMPLVDGDLWFECRLMMEAIRCYDLELIASIAT